MLRFSFLFLFQILLQTTFAQGDFIALITNPEVGENNNAQNLLEVVDSINQNSTVTKIVVLGNITANGKFDEFIWAQEILDGLSVPYFVVGGNNDYLLSEGRGSEISLIWGDENTFSSNKYFDLVCLNTIVPEFPDVEFIDAEIIKWFGGKVSDTSSKRVLLFSFNSINSIRNNFDFLSQLNSKKFYSFTTRSDNVNNNIFESEGFYLNRGGDWGYSLIEINSDSILIENIIVGDVKKSELIKTQFAPVSLDKSEKIDGKILKSEIIWEKKFNSSTITGAFFSDGKIFASFKNGSVVCLNESGKEKWSYQTNGRIYASPIIEKDLLVIATNEGDLLTLNANTGNLVQVIGIGESITSEAVVINIEEDGYTSKAAVVGTARGNLFCYDLYTLESIWMNNDAINWLNSSIVGNDNKVLFLDKEGTLYCVSAQNGLLLWLWKPPVKNTNTLFKSDIIVIQNNIYLVDAGGNLHCIDALLGLSKWNLKNINATGLIRVNSKGELILATEKNRLLIISAQPGKIINEVVLSLETNDEQITDFIALNGKMAAGFSNGVVYEMEPNQKPKPIYNTDSAPIISLSNISGNCLVTDYDGNLSFIKVYRGKK